MAIITLEVRGASWYQTPCNHHDKAFSVDGHKGDHQPDEEKTGPQEEIENAEGISPQRGRGSIERAARFVPCQRLTLRGEKRKGDAGTCKTYAEEYDRFLAMLASPPPVHHALCWKLRGQ
tara:strand:+ start:94 stop:453 length:360 start_codon:yes stop_codon:yes gene_type:complete